MNNKIALIVDDSKSARFVLKRMLGELNIEVDTVESAKQALDYLAQNIPDVIFMDHMMPGMDGFEAVKLIKENARTAIIPILMYTSKSGDVYLSQARALGAIGVIAKTIAPADLQDSLLKLGIIDEETASKTSIKEKPAKRETIKKESPDKKPEQNLVDKNNSLDSYVEDLHRLMDDQTVELHKSMWLGIESVSNEIFNRLNSELEEKLDKLNSEKNSLDEIPAQHQNNSFQFYLVSALLLVSVIFNITLYLKTDQHENRLEKLVSKQASLRENMQSEQQMPTDDLLSSQAFIQWALNRVIEYPFDELALNEKRIAVVEKVVQKALASQYQGRIILQTHAGKFCMVSDETGSYQLAEDLITITACGYIGNRALPGDDPATHQSIAFANYLSDLNEVNEKGVFIEVVSLPRNRHLADYPERSPETQADAWNKAAQANNRITIKLEPAYIEN